MAAKVSSFYSGSHLLQPLTGFLGIPVDQLNFVASNLLAVGLGQMMRRWFSPDRVSSRLRLALEMSLGLILLYFSFGFQVRYMFYQAIIAYLMLAILPPATAAIAVTIWSLVSLAVIHIYRMQEDYGGYTLDISGPIMIQTQRLSSLAVNLYDGARIKRGEQGKMLEIHRTHAVAKLPNPLELGGYLFYFHGVMAGPFVFYVDYRRYIEGYGNRCLPDSKKQLTNALFLAVVHGVLTAYIAPQFPYQLVLSHEFQVISMSRRMLLTTISFFITRQKYYFAWSLAEAAAVSAGLGYTGKCPRSGETQWATVRNYDFFAIETGSSLKVIADGWNIATTHWLREVVYDRTPLWCRTLLVFTVSAFWHGFYPGYYLMFLTFALYTFSARTVRRNCRPYFQTNMIAAKGYDIFTTVAANMAMNYAQAPFFLLDLPSAVLFWKPFYFFPHTVAMFILLCVHLKPKFVETMKMIERK